MRYHHEAIEFLKKMVAIPSHTFKEGARADFIENYLQLNGVTTKRIGNNIIGYPQTSDSAKETLMLNSHIDTVPPSTSYSFDPYDPPLENERILGLGSNDAGGSVTSLIHTFLYFFKNQEEAVKLNVNLLLVLSAEEERSGAGGMRSIADEVKEIADFAIIGEPTGMRAAIAERGLLVIDCVAEGISGHVARGEGKNAIYVALKDIELLKNYLFEKISPSMGEVRIAVTQINGGTQHNIIPDRCEFVADIRTTEQYTNSEIIEILSKELTSTLKGRSLTNRSSATPQNHRLLQNCTALGIEQFVSPTTSDWMVTPVPAIKMGVGDSARSHRADEYVRKEEISEGIDKYIEFIKNL